MKILENQKSFWIIVLTVLAFCTIPLLIGMISKEYWIAWRLQSNGYQIDYAVINTGIWEFLESPIRFNDSGEGKQVTNETLAMLSQMPHMIDVRFSDMDCTELNFKPLTEMPNLIRLTLTGCTHLQQEELQKIGHCLGLATLTIEYSPVTCETIQHWEKCPLQFLQLWGCHLTGAELEQISTFSQISYLNLGANSKITDAELEHLLKLKKLRILDVTFTSVTNEGVEDFQKKHPNSANLEILASPVGP